MRHVRHSLVVLSSACLTILALAGTASAAPPVKGDKAAPNPTEVLYYYVVTNCDGSVEVKNMTSSDATQLLSSLHDTLVSETTQWAELAAKWRRVAAGKEFPVPKPRPPKVEMKLRVPADEEAVRKVFDKLKHQIESWDVCLVRTMQGEVSAEIIRHDRIYGRQIADGRAYAETMIGIAEARKHNAGGKPDRLNPDLDRRENADNALPKAAPAAKLVRPLIAVQKDKFTSAEDAQKALQALNDKLAEREKKMKEQAAKDSADGKPAPGDGGPAQNPKPDAPPPDTGEEQPEQ